MKRFLLPTLYLSILLFQACTSGKSALKQGDYYDAVLQAVNRLRHNPDHKKSREVLSLSYQMAINFLESDAQNQIASNANFKWKNAVQNYDRINNLYEQIRTSPGAMKVIPNPTNKYKELVDVKAKAAEETYEAGIQAMLKNTREDAKRAYYLFTEANGYSPGYREAIEMMEQSKFNATLKVVIQPADENYYSWNFESIVFGANSNEFVKFYTPLQAQDQNLAKVDQYLKVVVNGYSEGRPIINKRVENYKDSVKSGEKTVNGIKVPVYQKVSAQMTVYEKEIYSKGSISLVIVDATSQANLKNSDIISERKWSDRWASCSGDQRALSEANRKLCGAREPTMTRNYLMPQTKSDLDNKLTNTISQFYRAY